MRQTTTLFVIVAGLLSLGVFVLKYEVQDLEHDIQSLNRRIVENREAIHVLDAEWSYLNDPARIRKLAAQFTKMRQVLPGDQGTFDSLPMRPETPAAGSDLSPEPTASPHLTAQTTTRSITR